MHHLDGLLPDGPGGLPEVQSARRGDDEDVVVPRPADRDEGLEEPLGLQSEQVRRLERAHGLGGGEGEGLVGRAPGVQNAHRVGPVAAFAHGEPSLLLPGTGSAPRPGAFQHPVPVERPDGVNDPRAHRRALRRFLG